MKTPTMAIQAGNGEWFAVRYLPNGARYGRGNRLTVDGGDTVQFWDLSSADDSDGDYGTTPARRGFGPLGNFTGASYFVATLLDDDPAAWSHRRDLRETGLCLAGGVDAWNIDGGSMRIILSWMRRTRAELAAAAEAAAERTAQR